MINIENEKNNFFSTTIYILLSIILLLILTYFIYIKKEFLFSYFEKKAEKEVEKIENTKSNFPNGIKRKALVGEDYLTEFSGVISNINQTIEDGVYITFTDTNNQTYNVKVSDGLTKKLSFLMEKRNNFVVKCKKKNEKFIFQCDIYTQWIPT